MFDEDEQLKSFFNDSVKCITKLVKMSNQTSTKHSDLLYMGTFKEYVDNINNINIIIQKNIRNLSKSLGCTTKWPTIMKNTDFHTEDSDKELIETIIDVNDYFFEKIEGALEEVMRGKSNGDVSNLMDKYNLKSGLTDSNIINCKSILMSESCHSKPQILWKKKLTNDSEPYEPSLEEKPNALIPLGMSLDELSKLCNDISVIQHYPRHPYAYEIYMHKYNINTLKKKRSQKIKPIRPFEVDYHYIETIDQLQDFLNFFKSSNIKEIAVDLEAHQKRSYLGFVCLMQISTRKEDFIIDTIALHDHLTVLNEIFTNPTILKIFHGAESDIKWLQRDFNIFVVNMFDTFIASKKLSFPKRNLAYLLKHYCNVDTDKSFQKADWRIRPLTKEMIRYARIDTHYLHHIYDKMIVELLKCDCAGQILLNVLNNSKNVALNIYEKPPTSDVAFIKFKEKLSHNMTFNRMHSLEQLFHWRQSIAQKHDESPEYVLPRHMLLELANRLPKDKEGIFAICSPLPPLINEYLENVCHILKSNNEDVSNKNNQTINHSHINKDKSKSSMASYLRIDNDGFISSFKIDPSYLFSNQSEIHPIYVDTYSSDSSLALKRMEFNSKLSNDIHNSFVHIYTLYHQSLSEKKKKNV